jgi:Holliday junction resolvase-like predicted endonuclease
MPRARELSIAGEWNVDWGEVDRICRGIGGLEDLLGLVEIKSNIPFELRKGVVTG